MKKIIPVLLLFISTAALAQKKLYKRIIVTLPDSVGIHEKIKLALMHESFRVSDDGRKDTLKTAPFETGYLTYIIFYGIVKGNSAVLSGYIQRVKADFPELVYDPLTRKSTGLSVFYYRKDQYWKKLMAVASQLNGTITFDN